MEREELAAGYCSIDKVQISFTVCASRSAGFQPARCMSAGWKPDPLAKLTKM